MPQDHNAPSTRPSNNDYLQPFAIALLAAIFGFGNVYSYSGDVTRALTVGGVAFLSLFWVVLRGNNLKKQRECKSSLPALTETSETSKGPGLWTWMAVACLILLGLPAIIHNTVGTAFDPAQANRSIRSKAPQDDSIKRVRKIKLHFWTELSKNSHPSFAGGVDAAVAALEIPVHSIKKNWPTGPTEVTYEGTAMDAYEICKAFRSAGVPTSSYSAGE